MHYTTTLFTAAHIGAAVALDFQWFGDKGIRAADLYGLLVEHPNSAIALLRKGTFCGFATFEVIDRHLPTGYVGVFPQNQPVLFIHQFTTDTNYCRTDISADVALLQAIEQLAIQKAIYEVAEALDKHHPYSDKERTEFDAFGFYAEHGYTIDAATHLVWQPSEVVNIDCLVFRKRLVALTA